MIHAFFKAILFVSTGNFIHYRYNYQHLNKTGGLIYAAPYYSNLVIISTFCIRGSPFAAAFFSKEPILELITVYEYPRRSLLLIIIGVSLTVIYRRRFCQGVLVNINKSSQLFHTLELSFNRLKGVRILILPAFISGSIICTLINFEPVVFLYPRSLK